MQLTWALLGLVLAGIGMSFLGHVHSIGDSFAVFRAVLCLILIALGVRLVGFRRLRFLVIAAGGLGLATILFYKLPIHTAGPIKIYQKNVFHANTDLAALAMDILDANPDFVTLQEVSLAHDPLLKSLEDAYPHQHVCRFTARSGVAVLSRIAPTSTGTCSRGYAKAQITVDLPSGRHHVAAVHMSWPFPGGQPQHIKRLVDHLETLDHPILIGGDFNMVPWSSALSAVARASHTRRAGPARTTFLIGFLPISIDHVFAPGGGYVETRPLFGSDHFGLLAHVSAKGDVPGNSNRIGTVFSSDAWSSLIANR